MKLYNSYTLKTEEFKPIEEGKVSMYVCGPTVYNHAHIGNARPIVVFDTLRRTFEALGYKVKFVSNFTDVDDKIINKALEEGVSEKEIAERYIKAYNDVRNSLNIVPLDVTPRVTETMDEIISFIVRQPSTAHFTRAGICEISDRAPASSSSPSSASSASPRIIFMNRPCSFSASSASS